MRLLYFAWLRAKIGTAEEVVAVPPQVADVKSLLAWLHGRGPGYAEALKDLSAVRVAVNHEYVGPDHRLGDADEVAIFPPMTGG